jgi:mono/diheme cytochrome c family protein
MWFRRLVGCASGSALALGALAPTTALAADGASIYAEDCASCHGEKGRADTGIGRALQIASFEGKSFTREQLEKLATEDRKHSMLGDLDAAELDALVEALNAMASS